jgi:hypothetical protein
MLSLIIHKFRGAASRVGAVLSGAAMVLMTLLAGPQAVLAQTFTHRRGTRQPR